jgi:esterase/lipase
MKTLGLVVLGFAVLLAIGAWATRPPALSAALEAIVFPADVLDDLDAYLRETEAAVDARFGITPGAEKRIVWATAPGERSEHVLVYLHGFSATRQEIAPVPERVAAALGANLFETRLAGHGQKREQIAGLTAERWLEDGSEALAIARALGERIIFMGTSTGATLALALARHPDFAAVESLILLSPNWGPAAEGSEIATGPYGPQLTRVFAGEWHSWEPANALQGRYWTTRYPTASIVEMMRLVNLARSLTPVANVDNALLVYSPKDDVVSVPRLLEGFEALPATRKEILRIDEPKSLSTHVLTGDILAPESTQEMAAAISAFLLTPPLER